MSERNKVEPEKIIESLKVVQKRAAYVFETQNTVNRVQDAIDLIKRQAVEIARLTAEVERLTPRPRTLQRSFCGSTSAANTGSRNAAGGSTNEQRIM